MKMPIDEWGHDPTVQRVRRLFALMEKEQTALLTALNLSASDPRLRACREAALGMYEKACDLLIAGRIAWDERAQAGVYIHCFLRALENRGVGLPDGVRETYPIPTGFPREVLE